MNTFVLCYILLKPLYDAAVEVASATCSLPKRILKLLLRMQIKVICLAFDNLIKGLKILKNTKVYEYICPKDVSPPEPVVTNEKILKGIKNFRRALYITMEQVGGLPFDKDLEILIQRLDDCRANIMDRKKFREALARLDEHNKPFRDGSVKNWFRDRFEVHDIYELESKPESYQHIPPVDVASLSPEMLQIDEVIVMRKDKERPPSHIRRIKQDKKPVVDHPIYKGRLTLTNKKLEEVLKMSSKLVTELTKFNTQFNQINSVSKTMETLQRELGEGRKLICEIEADRNALKTKLLTLEHMIKEEEKYLDEASCESGFEDFDVVVASTF